MILVDTHAHLTQPEYHDLAEVLERAQGSGVKLIINASFDIEASENAVRLASDYDSIYAAVGVHPHDAESFTPETFDKLKELAQNPKVVAIGETGLDYHYTLEKKEVQKEVFRSHLRLAQQLARPAIIHDREAHSDITTILREENRGELKGVLHCFSGDLEMAEWALAQGFYLSFTGNLTFKNAHRLRELAAALPLEKILLETDCPYLSPEPFRGRRNEPSYLIYIAEKIAEIKKVGLEEVAEITTRSAKSLFGLAPTSWSGLAR